MLTQVGRRALHEEAEEPPYEPPTQNHAKRIPVPPEPTLTQCQSKTAVSPVILQNLGIKRSRPCRPIAPIVRLADPSDDLNAPSDPARDQNEKVESLSTIVIPAEDRETSPPQAIDAGGLKPVPAHSSPRQNPLSKAVSPVTLDITSSTRRQRSSLIARGLGDLDRSIRPTTTGSPLGRLHQGSAIRRLGVNRSPLDSRSPSTGKKSDGQDDMYLAFGLMIKAKEREELLEEKVRHPPQS